MTSKVLRALADPNENEVPPPGFDCKKATTPQEKIIYLDSSLAKADKSLNQAYQSLRDRIDGESIWLVIRNSQRQWIKDRDRSCAATESDIFDPVRRRDIAKCLENASVQRAKELDVWF